jgi:hypothetical protein
MTMTTLHARHTTMGARTSMTCAVMLAVLFLCAIRGADAQHFTIYGLQGFLYDPVKQYNGTYKFPCWVPPYYYTIGGAYPLGTYTAGQVYVSAPKDCTSSVPSTSTGRFYTPQAVDVGPGGMTMTDNGVEVGSFGHWEQNITSSQWNFGLYFAGSPATYTYPAQWQGFVDGTYTGKVVGIYRNGYQLQSGQGTVKVTVGNPTPTSIQIAFNLTSDLTQGWARFSGRGSVNPQGFSFQGTGLGEDYLFNAYREKTSLKSSFYLGGNGQGLFFGQNGRAISGLLEAGNTSGLPDGGIRIAIAFGACNDLDTACVIP